MSWRVTRKGSSTSAMRENSPERPDEVVLVAAVGVARGVGVVLEQEDVAADALVGQAALGVEQQVLEDPLARLVVGDQLGERVALRGGVLRVRADVEVEARAVAQEDVGRPPPRHDPAEQVAGHLVGREAPLAVEGAGDTELGLDPVNPPLHAHHPKRSRGPVMLLERPGPGSARPDHYGRPRGAPGTWTGNGLLPRRGTTGTPGRARQPAAPRRRQRAGLPDHHRHRRAAPTRPRTLRWPR